MTSSPGWMGILRASPDHALPWLAAQPVAAAVAIAHGDSDTAADIIERATMEYAERGLAWPHATALLDDVRSSLVDSPDQE